MALRLIPTFLVLPVLSVLCAACNQTALLPEAAVQTPLGVTPSGFKLPEGTGCTGETARFRAVMDNDLETGHVTRSVHGRVTAEIGSAESVCTAGRSAEAERMLMATKTKFGYR